LPTPPILIGGNVMSTAARLLIGPLLVAGLLFVGCRGGSAPLLPVSGKVTYRGMPLQSGSIVFIPDASRGNNGPLAIGQIRVDGTYTIKTGDANGAAPGWYRITVASIGPAAAGGPPYRIPVSLLPEKYRDPDLSQLACEVKPKPNSIDLDLE
jgi:hypothetical protein